MCVFLSSRSITSKKLGFEFAPDERKREKEREREGGEGRTGEREIERFLTKEVKQP